MVSKEPGGPSRNVLQEKDFIQDRLWKNPFPFWIWLVILTTIVAIFWGSSNWYANFISKEVAQSPFLQVTNRQFSLFLWQFPEYMRINSKSKQGYLTGFQYEKKISLVLEEADNYVVAPPNLIFLYHTWDRLLSPEFTSRAIPSEEFKEFLAYAEEWQPRNWRAAPLPYVNFINGLERNKEPQDLNQQDDTVLPLEVRQAFQGWKNYFKEGNAINAIQPTYAQMRLFLKDKPDYARNYWRNILEKSYPLYLSTISDEKKSIETVPKEDIAPFLRVAFYNYSHRE